jgi:transcription initiation factor TFIIB
MISATDISLSDKSQNMLDIPSSADASHLRPLANWYKIKIKKNPKNNTKNNTSVALPIPDQCIQHSNNTPDSSEALPLPHSSFCQRNEVPEDEPIRIVTISSNSKKTQKKKKTKLSDVSGRCPATSIRMRQEGRSSRTSSKLEKSKIWDIFESDKKIAKQNGGIELGSRELVPDESESLYNVSKGVETPRIGALTHKSSDMQTVFVVPHKPGCGKTEMQSIGAPTQSEQYGEVAEIRGHIQENKKDTSVLSPSAYEVNREYDLCELCNSTLVISDDGFPTCCNQKCGIIYKNTLDYSPEWRYYGAEDKNQKDPTRCGNPINPLLIESSFSCKVLLSSASTYEMRKIYKWTEWQSMPHREKSLYDEFQFITIMAQNAGIPKIFIDDAIVIHKDISEQKMFRGMNRDAIKAASIYISCRLNGCPRTAHEIAEIFILDKASATSGCSMAVKILNNIERKYESSDQSEMCSTRPIAFIDRYCSKLNINSELTMLSKFIANKIDSQSIINNNTPHAIAAGIMFFISQNCNLNISKMDIKIVCGVSEVTINKCYKKLENIKDRLIPNCILDKYL